MLSLLALIHSNDFDCTFLLLELPQADALPGSHGPDLHPVCPGPILPAPHSASVSARCTICIYIQERV